MLPFISFSISRFKTVQYRVSWTRSRSCPRLWKSTRWTPVSTKIIWLLSEYQSWMRKMILRSASGHGQPFSSIGGTTTTKHIQTESRTWLVIGLKLEFSVAFYYSTAVNLTGWSSTRFCMVTSRSSHCDKSHCEAEWWSTFRFDQLPYFWFTQRGQSAANTSRWG